MNDERIAALRQALEFAPDNHPLRHMLAEALREDGRVDEALVEYDLLLQEDAISAGKVVGIGRLALQNGDVERASRCLDVAVSKGVIQGVAGLRASIDEEMEKQGYMRVVMPPAGGNAPENHVEAEPPLTFENVGGLDDVKKTIHRMIILPYLRPEVYQRYGRESGGGVLMYGPPGCGKTMLARATAGECQLPFVNIRIEAIIDPYIGVSERNLHQAFESGRGMSPCVIFIDELDALAFSRRKRTSSVGRSLVDQMLQELDSIGSDNRGLLVMGASNAPWDIDDAMLRPGRYDRRVFVPPPDAAARESILKGMLKNIPQTEIELRPIVAETMLFSGADLKAVVDSAVDHVIDEALMGGGEPPLTQTHLMEALAEIRPTTLDWLKRAQNYVDFGNRDQRYDDVADYLKSREVQRALR